MVNGSTLINDPWNTILSPFLNMLGNGFYLFPITFIALALYVKTHDVMLVSVWLILSGILLSSGSVFTGYMEMSIVYLVVIALGFAGLFYSFVWGGK